MTAEHTAHTQHTLTNLRLTRQIERNLRNASGTLISQQTLRLQQSHIGLVHIQHLKASLFRQSSPLGNSQRAGIHADSARQILLDLFLQLGAQIIGNQRHLVNSVVAARTQQTSRLTHNLQLVLIGLHGQHRLAHHGIVAFRGQTGLLGASVHHTVVRLSRCTDTLGHDFSSLGIKIHTGVALGGTLHNLQGSNTQARRKLHDINVATQSASQQPIGGLAAAGAQNLLAQLSQKPVTCRLFSGAVGTGNGRGLRHGRQLLNTCI